MRWGNRIQKTVDADGDAERSATVVKFAYDENGNATGDLDNEAELLTRRVYLDAVDALYARIDADTGDVD